MKPNRLYWLAIYLSSTSCIGAKLWLHALMYGGWPL